MSKITVKYNNIFLVIIKHSDKYLTKLLLFLFNCRLPNNWRTKIKITKPKSTQLCGCIEKDIIELFMEYANEICEYPCLHRSQGH